EKGLSLLGYHLCNYSLTKNVFKMVAYQKSYEKSTSCGGWIPWLVCPRMYYKTQYHAVEVPETITLTDCCEGYEQVGLYCSLALNRSTVFASRPGICPMENMETSDYPCTFDTECPGLKKCCNSSKGAGCVDPMPEGRTFWYNVTVLVKMDFNELIRVDSHLLNHSRLLHSMITGALQSLNASVHHIQSNRAEVYTGTVASHVLVGLHQPAPLAEVSSSLKDIVKRVYEVIDTEVQDVNECSYVEFNACPEKNTCVNLEGYYSCDPQHKHADVNPHQLSPRTEDPSGVRNHRIFSVTSNSFEMSWHVTSTLNHTFQVQVFKGKEIIQNLKTEEMKMDVSGLEAGVMYSVQISYETCGKTSISHQNVKTEAKMFGVTMRILNYNFTDDFHNASSSAYEEFSRLLLTELENSFPANISALYKSGKLKVQTESLQAGSIIVRLRITVLDLEFPVDASTFALVLSYLYNGSALLVDQQNTAVEDWDECASHAENDCSVFAECINLMGSYLCRCKTTMDTNPSRPGRNCEGEIVDPLTETTAPDVTNSTEFAPEEGSPAAPASPATTEVVAAVGSEMSTTVHLPAALPWGDNQVPHGHSPTSAPPAPWRKGLAPQMGFVGDNSPTATGVTASKELAVSAERQAAVSPSQQSSVAEASPGAYQRVAALTNAPMGTAGQEQLSSPLLVFPNQTAFGTTRSHTAFRAPQASSQGGPGTALLAIGDAGIPTLNATLRAHVETGRENSSWSEKYAGALESPALAGTSPAPSPTPGPATDRMVVRFLWDHKYAGIKEACFGGFLSRHDFFLSSAKLYLMTISFLLVSVPAQRIIVPNVTRTTFDVTWSTEFMQSPGFQFSLLQKKQRIWETKTQFRSPTVLELEPGALYNVEIRTDVCREESELVHQKVKTTVQKLSGTVRITNVKYSPGFSNTSSEEYQTFAQLFVYEVHKSLPPEVLQQMDAGLIKVLITGITNGSAVVSFNLLIAEDVDIYYIITAFRDAFEHSSYFTVDKSNLSIIDYDECKSKEDDCSPDASCHNTVGFYQCNCNEGFADVHPERPGRSSLEDTRFSSVVLSPLTMDPVSTPDISLQASPVPLVKPAQEVSIKDAVRVFCENEKIVLAVQKRFLQQESIPETSLYLGEPHCNVSISNGTHVVLQAGWSNCGTEVETNMTSTIVKTILRNDVSAQGVIHRLKIASPIHCVFENDLLASSGYTAEGLYTIFEDLHGSGHFRTEMQLFIGNSPIPKNFSVSASDDVLIEVGIQRADSKLKVVLTDCWATPTNNSVDRFSFAFISNSCPIPNTYTTLLENGNSSKAQFKMKIFSFLNNSVVYLHCKIRICMETSGSTCRTRCHAVRSLKTGETIATYRTSWGPLCKSAASDLKREKETGMGVGYIILIAFAVFGFVLGVVSLLIFQYQRKMGRYNFRIKSDNFSYQVFYD
ncbi:UROL1 protein, partial [Fregata magnificens]|nr:UROL1 protein [Fregata magnificens]